MSVESALSRQLDIRFIDARAIATEAKLQLGFDGYSGKDQVQNIIEESIRIFENRPKDQRDAMKLLNSRLNSVKRMSGSSSCCGGSVDGGSGDCSSCMYDDGVSGELSLGDNSSTHMFRASNKKKSFTKFKMWKVRRPSWDL